MAYIIDECKMKIENIREKWGISVNASYDEVIKAGKNFWKDLGYTKSFILFKNIGKLKPIEYYELISLFGAPWSREKYFYSQEGGYDIEPGKAISRFSNIISPRLGEKPMPWHADIPNHGDDSFPWRSLYLTQNPNPQGGLTTWLNLQLDIINPNTDELDVYSNIRVLNQSWYREGEEINLQPFIKTHPITGVKSLRANYFIHGDNEKDKPWIKESYLKDKKIPPYELLGPIYKKLSLREDLTYTHSWDRYDLIIYDNWNFIHRRSHLELKSGEERLFLRANIAHELSKNT